MHSVSPDHLHSHSVYLVFLVFVVEIRLWAEWKGRIGGPVCAGRMGVQVWAAVLTHMEDFSADAVERETSQLSGFWAVWVLLWREGSPVGRCMFRKPMPRRPSNPDHG
jgi:hypothetical protein